MNVRHRVPVWHCVPVESTVIATGSPVTRSLLGDHVEGRGPGNGGGTDDAQLEHVFEFPLGSLETVRCEASGACEDWRAGGFNGGDLGEGRNCASRVR